MTILAESYFNISEDAWSSAVSLYNLDPRMLNTRRSISMLLNWSTEVYLKIYLMHFGVAVSALSANPYGYNLSQLYVQENGSLDLQ